MTEYNSPDIYLHLTLTLHAPKSTLCSRQKEPILFEVLHTIPGFHHCAITTAIATILLRCLSSHAPPGLSLSHQSAILTGKKKYRVRERESASAKTTFFVIISNEITCPSSLEIVKFTIIPSNRTERLAGQSSHRNITTNACNKGCAKRPGIQQAATTQQKNNQVHHSAPWLPFPLPVTSSPTWPHFDRISKTSSTTITISRQLCQKTKTPRAVPSGKIQSKSAQD